jgi:hypothetical protein
MKTSPEPLQLGHTTRSSLAIYFGTVPLPLHMAHFL